MKLLFDICRFDRSRNPDLPSPWCAAFDPEDLKVNFKFPKKYFFSISLVNQVLEYAQDLQQWYKSSYGSDINTDIACPLIQDMAKIFKQETLL